MQDDLKNILSSSNENVSQQHLLKYLKDELSETEKHELEANLLNDEFETDALEGLADVENNERLQLIVDGLNRDLKKRVEKKNNKRNSLKLKPLWPLYFSILIFLIIIVLVYFYLHKSTT